MKVVWRSSPENNDLESYAQVIDLGGDFILEVLSRRTKVWERVKIAIRYIFKDSPIVYSQVILDEDIAKIGGAIDDRKDD